ncbi:MAG: hypothetical protein ACTHKC_08405 [Candidatus Nitrosocosmicus sp.]
MFRKGKEVADTRPKILIRDGAPNFHTAFNKGVMDKQITNNQSY